MRYAALAVAGGNTGVLISRSLFPFVLNRGGLLVFLVLPILILATLLFARALRRGRLGA